MTVETSTKCPNCNKATFARYGSSGWAKWQVCPHCGLAELRQEVYQDENLEPVLYGDEALMIFFIGFPEKEPNKILENIEKYFSNEADEEAILKYSQKELSDLLDKRESLDYYNAKEPYIMALARRLEKQDRKV